MKSAPEQIIIKTTRKSEDWWWLSFSGKNQNNRLTLITDVNEAFDKAAINSDVLVIYDLDKHEDLVAPVIEAFSRIKKTGIVKFIFLYSKTPVDLKKINAFNNLLVEFIRKPASREMLEFTIGRMRSTRTATTEDPQVRDRMVADSGGNKKYNHDDHTAKNYKVLIETLSQQLVSEITQNIELRYLSGAWGSKATDNRSLISSLLEVIPDPVFFKNQNGQYLGCNKAYELFVNRPKEEIIGKTLYDFLDAEQAKYFTDKEKIVLETGTPMISQETVKLPDRQHNILHIQNRYAFTEGNAEHKGIIGLFIDQTDKIRAGQIRSVQRDIEYYSWLQGGLKSSLDYILNKLTEIYWIDFGGVYLFDEKGEIFELISHTGLSDKFVRLTSQYELSSQQVKMLQKKEALYLSIKDITDSGLDDILDEGLRFVAALPLVHDDKLIGSINLGSREESEITESDKLYAEFTASRLGSMIASMKANDELKQSWKVLDAKVKDRTKELREINQKLKKEITISKKAKDDLAISENLYRSIFNNAQDGIVLYNAKTQKLVDLNVKAYSDLGYTREEFMSLNAEDFTIYDYPGQRNEFIDQLMQKGRIVYRVRHRSKKGETLFRIIHASIVEIGAQVYILGIIHDITQLKLTEFQLQETEARVKDMVEGIPIGVFRITRKGTPVFLNIALRKLLGVTNPMGYADFQLEQFGLDRAKQFRMLRQLVKNGSMKNHEMELSRADGSYFLVNINIQLFRSKSRLSVFFDGTVDDITDLRKAQTELTVANQLILEINKSLEKRIKEALSVQEKQQAYILQKSKLESLGEMAAGIAHEINQPTGIISLAMENLKASFESGTITPKYLKAKFESITEHLNRINKIIDNIRLFSRDQDNLALQKVFLNRIVKQSVALVKTQNKARNIQLELDLNDTNEFTVGSRVKVEQVIYNLLSNARYAVEEKDVLTNEAGYQKIIRIATGVTDNKKLFLEVSDNGIGIPKENLAKVFDPFFTTKNEFKGSGLGLSVVFGIIHEMKGRITVESELNRMTKFRIELPMFPEKD